MSKISLNVERGKYLYEKVLKAPEKVPVAFVYDGKEYQGLGALKLQKTESAKNRRTLYFALDKNVTVELATAFCPEFGEVEYTLWFTNTGKSPSKVLSELQVISTTVEGKDPVLRGCLGDHEQQYAPYERDLTASAAYYHSESGRATHVVFPYFDFVHGDGGTLMALGWAGTWAALFSPLKEATRVQAWSCSGFKSVLMPGERIRTGLVVLLPYKGRNADDAANLWREWWIKYNMPRANAAGDAIKPFSTADFASDTGLPNSDGSISERASTWKPTLDKIIKEKLKPDFRWFDAGWYADPAGNTVESDWWGTVGTWELDKVKWPGKTFRESNEACHKAGIKVFMWFEPERVTHVEDLVKNHGYKAEWGLKGDYCVTNNLGDPACFRWTLKRILKTMGDNEVDLYREDNNSDPAGSWYMLDQAEEKKLKLPRCGINENKSIQAHYALWDGIIDFGRKHGKCTFVDSCASGGGRNDIESMRRGLPFLRSDADREWSSRRLSMTASFCKWIPFHGSSIKESAWQLDAMAGAGSDTYVNRASLLPIYNMCGIPFTHSRDLDFDRLRRNFAEWKSVRDLLTQDMYVLTPWHHTFDRYGWSVFAYDAPEKGESIVLAFREEKCAEDTFTAKLPFAEDGVQYRVTNDDTGKTRKVSGKFLRTRGIRIKLSEPRSSALFRMTAE